MIQYLLTPTNKTKKVMLLKIATIDNKQFTTLYPTDLTEDQLLDLLEPHFIKSEISGLSLAYGEK